ncbi:MAG: OmpL47-type beta-barrel domain-containing protein [Anaerolineales bacterium]
MPGSAGWCRGGAAVNLSASEPLSGKVIQIIEGNPAGVLCDPADGPNVTCSWSGSDGDFSLQFWAVSSYGDTSAMSSTNWKVDSGSPSITLNLSGGTLGGGGWYRGGTVSVSASGADTLSGFASAEVAIDGGAWAGSAQVSSDGVHSASGRVQDVAGNEATGTASVRYDSTPPTLSAVLSGTLGREGWYVSAVTASASASDSLSGVAERQVNVNGTGWQSGPVLLTQDGSHTLTFRAADVAGNEAISGAQTIRIDAHPPESVFVVPPNGSETWVSGIVELLGQSLDFGSGLRSVEISYDGGQTWAPLKLDRSEWGDNWDTRSVPNGTYVILARASDVAGHLESTAKVTLRVDNLAPIVDIPDSWLVGELASLVVQEQGIGLAGVQILIQDGEQTLFTWPHTPELIPSTISWDGVMPDGSVAAPGEYGVYATAWDFAGNRGQDVGVIRMPGADAPIPIEELSISTLFGGAGRLDRDPQTGLASGASPSIARSLWLWPAVAWFGLLGGVAISKLSDPRPAALTRLRRELDQVRLWQAE